jgi:hypothetical protein
MLQNLNSEISECYQHALENRRWADESRDPGTKQDFLAVERRWLQLAHNYEFAQRLSNFAEPFRRRKRQSK